MICWKSTCMLIAACAFFAWAISVRHAKSAEVSLTCELVRKGVALVGTDQQALVKLAESYGYTVTPAQKRKARHCLTRGKSRWAKRSST